ncbi:hypothetical protein AcW1_008641 [Taiwanofungus camphoratus]|nr:hypothetical protein AcV5_006660 [Antrodia cinnamomea]KAI0948896.1 hypothetical protein AcW1_008641 [Antrodia cinnamomea]
MESILYVVLYCAIQWGPHDASAETVSNTLRLVFDEAWKQNTITLGELGKRANKICRMFTNFFKFESDPLRIWLDTVMNLNSPLPGQENDYFRDKWEDPSHLNTFWTKLLQTSTLDKSDRKERELYNTPLGCALKPTLSSGAGLTSSKRKEPASSVETDARQTKHSRTGLRLGEAVQDVCAHPVDPLGKTHRRGHPQEGSRADRGLATGWASRLRLRTRSRALGTRRT